MKKVYLMIYDAGAGHRSTAKAIQNVIEQRKLPWEVHLVEAFKEVLGTSASQDFYNKYVLQKTWAKIINEPLLVPLFKLQIHLSHSAWLARLKKFWQQQQPDIVVSVQPYLNRVLCESLQAASPDVPFVTFITDHADCPPHFWIEKQEQFLICPTKKAVEQAKSFGYTHKQLFRTSGVIIQPQFYEPVLCDRRAERQRLGLDPNLPTALITFGSQGSNIMLEIAESLEKSQLNLQLIFICGRNEELAATLRSQQSRLPRFIETFTSEIPYYMHLSDFFIGKSGSVGVSEAVAMNLPVITDCNALSLFQEKPSAQWIADNEIGIVVRNFKEINQAVAKLIQPENLARYRANAAAINNQAVFEVVDILERLLEQNQLEIKHSTKGDRTPNLRYA